ncbi:MAG TPA: hypothetical protein VGW74_09390 [Propionibacteriaceae bacterium]|nr:hypothetical protein [Propionibacteriaceae bacterium]
MGRKYPSSQRARRAERRVVRRRALTEAQQDRLLDAAEPEAAEVDRLLAEGWVPDARPVGEVVAELRERFGPPEPTGQMLRMVEDARRAPSVWRNRV